MPDCKEIRVNTVPAYTAIIGPSLLKKCGQLLRKAISPCHMAVVTDSAVGPLYLETVTESLKTAGYEVSAYEFPAGEEHKNMTTLSAILEFLAKEHLTRTDCLIALGGGVAGDMAGFAAACYLRGIRYVQMPTTLLSAVDSSVGGKTAIDLGAGKNLAGAFLQPAAVLCDTDCLKTLPQPAEVIARCVAYKAGVVERDEKEQGERKLLNLGHTVGHAIEKCSGYAVPHGRAVAAGLAVMARAAERLGWTNGPVADRVGRCLEAQGLPVSTEFSPGALAEAALADKKRSGGSITLVVPKRIGLCELKTVPVTELLPVIRAGWEA